ncbi:MAG TPA: DsbA family oxidoreductase [Xanthobacteraceae bacterium]
MTHLDTPEALQIDVVSDVVCPWCFIGKRRLEQAIALCPDIPVEVNFRPYFLNPWVPRAGMTRTDYLTKKFGSVERYGEIAQRVATAAAEEGLTYAVDKMSRQPNTLDSHRVIFWARNSGAQACVKQRLMDFYFTEGADLSDQEVLVKAATECGMDGEEVRRLLATDTDVERVTQEAESARSAGINGVPTFIFGGAFSTSGAQPPETLAEIIAYAAAEQEKRRVRAV